jgi:hypothetical protein
VTQARDQDFPVGRFQSINGLGDSSLQLAPLDGDVRGLDRRYNYVEVKFIRLGPAPPAQVRRLVLNDRQEPRFRRRSLRNSRSLLNQRQESGLDEVLRLECVSYEVNGNPQQAGCRQVKQLGECTAIGPGKPPLHQTV